MKTHPWIKTMAMGLLALQAADGRLQASEPDAPTSPAPHQTLEATWGIQVASLRVSANGYMVDFRYKVLDPAKASQLANRDLKPYLVDQDSGTRLYVPEAPKIGPLRQTAQQLKEGRTYFVLFANRGKIVKPGDQVTIGVGDVQLENLTVD